MKMLSLYRFLLFNDKHHVSRHSSQVIGCWVIKFVLHEEAQKILKFCTGSESKKSVAILKILKEGKSCVLDQNVVGWSTLHWTGHVPTSCNMMMAQTQIFLKELNL